MTNVDGKQDEIIKIPDSNRGTWPKMKHKNKTLSFPVKRHVRHVDSYKLSKLQCFLLKYTPGRKYSYKKTRFWFRRKRNISNSLDMFVLFSPLALVMRCLQYLSTTNRNSLYLLLVECLTNLSRRIVCHECIVLPVKGLAGYSKKSRKKKPKVENFKVE